jgi:hypothetical protein
MTYTSNDKLVNPTSNQPAHLQSVSPNSSTKWFIISLGGLTGGSLYTLAGQHEDRE